MIIWRINHTILLSSSFNWAFGQLICRELSVPANITKQTEEIDGMYCLSQ
jgi:hypothetical protein